MRENKTYIWSAAGCAVFMMIGLICWYVLCTIVGLELSYFIVALVNFIGFIGHGITNQLIRRFVKKGPRKDTRHH